LTTSGSVLVLFAGVDKPAGAIEPRWSESLLSGVLHITGAASHEAQLTFTLTRTPGGKPLAGKVITVPAPGGAFVGDIGLRKLKLLPGTAYMRVSGTVSKKEIPARDVNVRVPAPPEGVVKLAYMSSTADRKPLKKVPRRIFGIRAHFVFAAKPAAGSKITTSWYQGTHLLGTAPKPRQTEVVTEIDFANSKPIKGFYMSVLKVNGKIVKRISINVR
jgi:hypothetical protein